MNATSLIAKFWRLPAHSSTGGVRSVRCENCAVWGWTAEIRMWDRREYVSGRNTQSAAMREAMRKAGIIGEAD